MLIKYKEYVFKYLLYSQEIENGSLKERIAYKRNLEIELVNELIQIGKKLESEDKVRVEIHDSYCPA